MVVDINNPKFMINLSICKTDTNIYKTCEYLDTQEKVTKFYEIISKNDESMGTSARSVNL